MEKLNTLHHKTIILIIALTSLVIGIMFGITLAASTRGTDGMQVMIFSLGFLSIVIQFIIFIQLVHLNDKLENNSNDKRKKQK